MSSLRSGAAIAWVALGLAVVLAFVDRDRESSQRPAGGPSSETTWMTQVETGADHMEAGEFVRRLLDEPSSLLVVDVRLPDEFAAFHLPGSVNLDVPRLLGDEGRALLDAHEDRMIVLVSEGMTHPGQAWVELARRGHENVRILEDGLSGLRATHFTPPSLRGPTTEARAQVERKQFAVLAARWLGRAPVEDAPRAGRFATDPARLVAPTVVSTAWVEARLGKVLLLDARDKAAEYVAKHLPGAVHVPIAVTREVRAGVADEMKPLADLAALAGAWGVANDTEVVVYGGEKLQDPTHLALVLLSLGQRRVAVLEGGLGAWIAEGRPVDQGSVVPTPRSFALVPGAFDFGVLLSDVVAASSSGSTAILDVRPKKSFEGDIGEEARGGRIPGSVSRPYTEDVVAEGGGVWWRAKDDLLAGYAALGLGADEPVIVSCRTGHQASQSWFTLRVLLGRERVGWYDGSWKEWAQNKELPVETGPPGSQIKRAKPSEQDQASKTK